MTTESDGTAAAPVGEPPGDRRSGATGCVTSVAVLVVRGLLFWWYLAARDPDRLRERDTPDRATAEQLVTQRLGTSDHPGTTARCATTTQPNRPWRCWATDTAGNYGYAMLSLIEDTITIPGRSERGDLLAGFNVWFDGEWVVEPDGTVEITQVLDEEPTGVVGPTVYVDGEVALAAGQAAFSFGFEADNDTVPVFGIQCPDQLWLGEAATCTPAGAVTAASVARTADYTVVTELRIDLEQVRAAQKAAGIT